MLIQIAENQKWFMMVIYVKRKTCKKHVVWECEQRRNHHCHAIILDSGGVIVRVHSDHNHSPDISRCKVLEVRETMKTKAATTEETTHQIVTSSVVGLNEEAATSLLSIPTLRRFVRDVRKKSTKPSA